MIIKEVVTLVPAGCFNFLLKKERGIFKERKMKERALH